MIMDHALTLNFTPPQLRQINSCRIYLQVLTISDISTASGTHILPNILRGRRTEDRVSELNWPVTQRPANWAAWKRFLQHVSSGGRLYCHLGAWTSSPYQKWCWFYNPYNDQVYHLREHGSWDSMFS
jgi:hypothetical protein